MRQLYLILRLFVFGPYYGFIVWRSLRQVRRGLKGTSPSVVDTRYHGATYIDPKHLAIWFLVRTSADLARAREAGLETRLKSDTTAALTRNGYPRVSVPEVGIELESLENVEKAGGWHRYLR